MLRTRVAATATASLIAAATALSLTTPQAGAAPGPSVTPPRDGTTSTSDSLTPPWREKYEAIRDAAVQKRLRTGGTGQAERLSKGVYGKVAQQGTDRIFVVLAEFGDTRHSAYPDDPETGAQTFDGPMHNTIPKPNRAKDNSTL